MKKKNNLFSHINYMSVVLGLPRGLLPSPEAALSAGCDAQWVKIQPNNVSSVASNTFSGLAASTISSNIAFPSQQVNFSIPCGMGRNTWLDVNKTTLSFRVRYQVTGASTGSATTSAFVNSSALSFWDRMTVVNAAGQVLDDVVGLSQIETHKQIWSFDVAERDAIALNYGFRYEDDSGSSYNYLQGHSIPIFTVSATTLATGSNYFSYNLPLPSSILGQGARGWLPVGVLPKLDVQLYTNNILPVSISVGAGMTASASIVVTIDNISINACYLTLDDKSSALLGGVREHYIHGITNRLSSGVINSGVTGQTNVLLGLRGKSVRSIATRFSENALTTAGSANGLYDSKMPIATSINYFLAAKTRLPPNPINLTNDVATAFSQALQASEAFNPMKFRYGGSPKAFATYVANGGTISGANGYDQWLTLAGSSTAVGSLAAFTFAMDCRKASTSQILDGVDLSTSANNFLEVNLSVAPTNTLYCSFISSMDIIYVIDMATGNIEARS